MRIFLILCTAHFMLGNKLSSQDCSFVIYVHCAFQERLCTKFAAEKEYLGILDFTQIMKVIQITNLCTSVSGYLNQSLFQGFKHLINFKFILENMI